MARPKHTYPPVTPAPVRFMRHIEKTSTCWIWKGAIKPNGYGQFNVTSTRPYKQAYAHRFSYEMHVGPIPDGLDLDHLCRNRACVNPEHLEPVDRKTNLNRGLHKNADKTHCIRGHEFTPENTGYQRRGSRVCLACQKMRNARRGASSNNDAS